MGLDRKAGRKAKDAGPNKPLLKETPDGHRAKAYDDSRGIAGGKENFAVSKDEAD
jgi:hypothetical protein